MAMTFNFNIHPFGYTAEPIEFGSMRVHSKYDRHVYEVSYKGEDGWHYINGSIAKHLPDGTVRSGHRNFLHLLRDILADVALDDIGEDYVNVLKEIQEVYPHVRVSDYKGDR
jgi:hypothetical protein